MSLSHVPSLNARFRRILGLLALGLSVYLACGFSRWLFQCKTNRYFQQGLQTLAALELVNDLNRYSLMFAACAFGILTAIILARTARPWLARVLLRVEVVDHLRFRALATSFCLLIFFTGLAVLLGFEASLASASTTSPSMSEVLRGILALFSPSSSLKGFLLLMVIYGGIATLFIGATTALLTRLPLRSQGERTRMWLDSPWLRAVGTCELLLLATLNAWAWWGARAANDGPNVILISIDTLRADHLEAYGYARKTAPNIARLAATGVLFSNAYAQAPWTLASMASLHTGLYPHQHGALTFNTRIRDEATTLAEALKDINYFTIGITSAWFTTRSYGFAQGFDIFDQSQTAGADSVTGRGITDSAIRYLQQHRGRKFFLWIHYFDPHGDYVRHPTYGYANGYSGLLRSVLAPAHLNHVKDRLQAEDRQYVLDVYDEEIAYTDEAIGQLLQAVQKLDLLGRSIIVLTADHGEEFLERDKIGHGTKLYQELIHVPLIVAGITGVAFHSTEEPVEIRSVGRTILNLCGASKVHFPGADLLTRQKSAEVQNRGVIFSEGSHAAGSDDRREAAINWGWKLIHNYDDDSYELYDLQEDRQERRNLSRGTQDQQRIAVLLARELNGFRASVHAAATPIKLSEEELKRLRSLGYIK
jgi:arylsulfatase A-like enzyme